MRAFIGTVPFTIIEAINYVVSNEIQDADLYLVKVFADAEKVGKQVEETGVFQNVYIVEDVLLTYPITVKKCMNTELKLWGLMAFWTKVWTQMSW